MAHWRVAPDEVRGPRGEVLPDRAPARTRAACSTACRAAPCPPAGSSPRGSRPTPSASGERRRRASPARARASPCSSSRPPPPAPCRARAERRLLLPWLAHDATGRLRVAPPDDAPRLIHATPATLPDLRAAPALARHLARFRPVLEARRETRLGRRAWFHLHWPRDPRVVRGPRVLVPRWTRWPGGALVEDDCAAGESVWVVVPPDPADAASAAALLASLPFALGVLLVSKRRGRGVDVARAALAACPWPDTAAFVAARRGGGPLTENAARRIAALLGPRDPAARRAEGPGAGPRRACATPARRSIGRLPGLPWRQTHERAARPPTRPWPSRRRRRPRRFRPRPSTPTPRSS
ncbi:MAG: hypothetical protein KF878_32185 [Planctomycetes bacterium]|nr:hypothetical protein [Planctomycetota bacterium]